MPKYEEPALPFVKDKLIRDFNLLYCKVYDKIKATDN